MVFLDAVEILWVEDIVEMPVTGIPKCAEHILNLIVGPVFDFVFDKDKRMKLG